jgi:hypothetical protein
MPKFRKKPVVIEAVEFVGLEHVPNLPMWVQEACQDRAGSPSLFIKTLEGVMEASPGDWIIRGMKGEIYPCKADIFAMTYDPA